MLRRKMFRELKMNWGQFLSIFLLAFLAMTMFCTMEGHVIGENKSRATFHKNCNLADLWIYGEGFTQENVNQVKDLSFVKDVGLRMAVTGSAPECEGAQVDIYLERQNVVNKPYVIKGEAFDPKDTKGIWLTNAFAKCWNIKVGDTFKVEYNGITFSKKVKGLIESAEYEYRIADSDTDINLSHIAFVYMSYDAFPIKEYVLHMIEQGKITAKKVAENTKALDSQLKMLSAKGMTIEDITQDMLYEAVNKMDDEKLADIMPYTQMLVKTTDDSALTREEEIAKAIDDNYAAMVDEDSIMGIARLNSEISQHETFSYMFVVIFVGIAVLVIATSMSRMVEKQRTQIGTMNALGMKKHKVILHYISYSTWISLLGVIVGMLVGTFYASPFMVNLFTQWYIVPGLKAGFDSSYCGIAVLIVVVCAAASYLSCRRLLKVKPAEALRPAAPKQGKRCVFEKLPFWDKLGFNTQYNLRDISRAKLRVLMGIIGTAVGMLLMVYGAACNLLVDDMVDLNFQKIQPAAYQMKLSQDVSLKKVDDLAEKVSGELIMSDQIEIAKKPNASSDQKKKESLTVLEGKGLYNIVDTKQKVIHLSKGCVGLSRKLSADMGLKVGDTFYWHIYSQNEWYKAKVGVIYQSTETQGITYLREDFEKTGVQFTPSMLFSNEDLTVYDNLDYVTGVSSKKDMEAAYRTGMEAVNMMVVMMLVFSTILIVVVLYNSGNLSFHERVKEFATLKVLGLQSAQIRKILSIQNIWLSVIGILLGAPLGKVSLNAMMNSNGENFDYNLMIHPSSYIVSGILVLVVSMFVSFMFSKRIKNLDMVESLKGAE